MKIAALQMEDTWHAGCTNADIAEVQSTEQLGLLFLDLMSQNIAMQHHPSPTLCTVRYEQASCSLQAMESRLAGLGVRRLVVQSVRVLLPMWLGSLGFMPLTLAEADAVDDLLVSPDPDSAQLVKKSLLPG